MLSVTGNQLLSANSVAEVLVFGVHVLWKIPTNRAEWYIFFASAQSFLLHWISFSLCCFHFDTFIHLEFIQFFHSLFERLSCCHTLKTLILNFSFIPEWPHRSQCLASDLNLLFHILFEGSAVCICLECGQCSVLSLKVLLSTGIGYGAQFIVLT